MIETIVSSITSCIFADTRTASALEFVRSTSCYLKEIKKIKIRINKIRERGREKKRDRKVDKPIKKYAQIFSLMIR